MTKLEKIVLGIVVVIVIGVATIFGTLGFHGKAPTTPTQVQKSVGAQYQNDIWYFTGAPFSQVDTGLIYGQGGIIEGNGVSSACSLTPASSTAGVTLTAANLICSTLFVTSATSTTFTLTLPASSTMSSLVNSGDSQLTYIYAASTTAGNIVLAGGTGFTLASPIAVASSTAASSTIAAGTVGILDQVRLPTTNLIGIITPSK